MMSRINDYIVDTLKDMVIDLKVIEGCDTYDEFYDHYKEVNYIYCRVQQYEAYLSYEEAREILVEYLEREIIDYLKSNI